MHSIGKIVNDLHAMRKLHEQTLPKKDVAPALYAIRVGRIHKNNNKNKKPQNAAKCTNQGNRKSKLAYAHKPNIPPPPKKDNLTKDLISTRDVNADEIAISAIVVNHEAHVFEDNSSMPNVVNSGLTSPSKNDGNQVVHEVNDKMKNSLYVYFIGKRLAFLIVECFVRNNWEKYGLKWSPFVSLLKEELLRVLVWMKFHDFLLVAYTLDGLSFIPKKIGSPMMLGSYMKSMCLESWGQSNYERVLIEINARNDFSDNLLLEEKCVFMDDDGKPLKKVDYLGDRGSDDEVESIDNEMTSYLSSKPSGVGYDTKSLLEKWRETYLNADYSPYDDDMYEEEHELEDHNEPSNYKVALSDPDKWFFKKKNDMDGKVYTYKACLVIKGFTQTFRVDYKETFFLDADIRAIRIFIAISMTMGFRK
nr:hypothetical protein [Tanacetum cinerariifolium]